MSHQINIQVSPQVAADEKLLLEFVSREIKIKPQEIQKIAIQKRSIDARQRNIKINLQLEVFLKGDKITSSKISHPDYYYVGNKQAVIIVGAGPAGLFAALQLIEKGLKPIIIERGKNVKDRRRDLRALNIQHIVNEDSNYCFGEGGAGTYSDGKLYTRSKKRGDVQRILELLVGFGASPDILVDAHPHIGTNKLPRIIEAIRHKILECGGEIL